MLFCPCFTLGPVQGPKLGCVAPALPPPGPAGLNGSGGLQHWGSHCSRVGTGGTCRCGRREILPKCQRLSLHHCSGSGWHDRSSFSGTSTSQMQPFALFSRSYLAGEAWFQSGPFSSSSFWQQSCLCLHFRRALSQPCLIYLCFAYLQYLVTFLMSSDISRCNVSRINKCH